MKLQGNVNTTTKHGKAVKAGIWQVLPIFDELLKGFEDARERHLLQESQRASKNASPPSSPLITPSPIARRITRSSQIQVIT
jgi:hypothetical protein